MNEIKNKVIVITGASSGIGEETAISLAKKGAKVVLAARRVERLKTIVQNIKSKGEEATYFQTDVTSRSDMANLAEFAKSKFGTIDVWINNAGIMSISFLDKLKIDEWERMVDVNIKGVLYGIGAALPIMKENKQGHIINVSSMAGHRVGLAQSVYSGTKFAVRAITEGVRQELSSTYNIRATLISPGGVQTELKETITDKDVLESFEKQSIQQILEPNDIAKAIVYAIQQPEYVSVSEVMIRPTTQQL